MSKCTPKNPKFMNEIERTILQFRGVREVSVFYDAGKYSKRDYCADVTLYDKSDWTSEDTKYLKEAMREHGATAILSNKRKAIARTYLDMAFDIKESLLKGEESRKE